MSVDAAARSEEAESIRDLDRARRRRAQDAGAAHLVTWSRRTRSYHREQARVLRHHMPPGSRVLHVGCGLGDLLADLEPAAGLGIDLAPAVIALARDRHPALRFEVADPEAFRVAGTFDFILVSSALADMRDVAACLDAVRAACAPHTRVILCYHSALWGPVLRLLTAMRLRRPTGPQNWLGPEDFDNLLRLAKLDPVARYAETLLPLSVPVIGAIFNRFLAKLWPLRHLCLTQVVVARRPDPPGADLTCTVVIPTRNERGNVEAAIARLPDMGAHTEVIFVDGHSTDGTPQEIERVIAAHPERDIRLVRQGEGIGKGDAVRKGFAAARGDVLMILDADLTVPPEDLPRFFRLVADGAGEFVNGTRLVYPMEDQAMRFLNKAGNRFFSLLFTWLLGQRFRDTLCGTKALTKRNYETIAANRSFFGDFDPFGDFDLIFGAARANLRIVEVPVRYRARTYGTTNISRFRHGWLLLRMSWVAMRKLKLR
jgi:SAM-dependent methyltransferase